MGEAGEIPALIVKRNGDLVDFDLARISRAIAATGEPMTTDELESLTERVREEIGRRFIELYPNVENVQDIVEKHLMLDGRYATAKAYILYRADRQRARETARAETADRDPSAATSSTSPTAGSNACGPSTGWRIRSPGCRRPPTSRRRRPSSRPGSPNTAPAAG